MTATVSRLRRELTELRKLAGKCTRVMPWQIPGLYQYRQAKARHKILSNLSVMLGRDPVPLDFNPAKYGHDMAYFEAWDLKAFDYHRDTRDHKQRKLNLSGTLRKSC